MNTSRVQSLPVLSSAYPSVADVRDTPNAPISQSRIFKLTERQTSQHNFLLECKDPANTKAAQTFIAQVFLDFHNAIAKDFMPSLYALENDDESIMGVVGVRPLHHSKPFLEQYFDESVEAVVSQRVGRVVERHEIAEVGNLAATHLGSGRRLVAFVARHLRNEGFGWAICTATAMVRTTLKRTGIDFTTLSDADPSRLGDAKIDWGSYYQHKPQVVVIDLKQAAAAAANLFNLQQVL